MERSTLLLQIFDIIDVDVTNKDEYYLNREHLLVVIEENKFLMMQKNCEDE